MQDLIPRGTGNSRWMKSSIPTGTTWEEVLAMLRSGTFPFDLNGINSAGISQQGTALNKANLLPDAVATLYGLGSDAVPSNLFQILSQAALYKTVTPTAQLDTLPEGSIIYLNENGTPVPFYVAKQDYEPSYNTDRVLVVRQEASQTGAWNSSGVNTYDGSTIDDWFNQTYLQTLDADVQTAIGTTNIPYVSSRTASVTRTNKSVFALSLTEIGGSASGALETGTILPISLTLKSLNANQWTRSPDNGNNYTVWCIDSDGSTSGNRVTSTAYSYRPAFTLPTTFTAYTDAPTSGLYDVFDNLLLKLPGVQIATGSYTGTGTYGSSNPNSITMPFDADLVWIYSCTTTNPPTMRNVPFEANSATIIDPNMLNESYTLRLGFFLDDQGDSYGKKSGNTIYWYNDRGVHSQLNNSDSVFLYMCMKLGG